MEDSEGWTYKETAGALTMARNNNTEVKYQILSSAIFFGNYINTVKCSLDMTNAMMRTGRSVYQLRCLSSGNMRLLADTGYNKFI